LILRAVEKSANFDAWLTWLRSQIGQDFVIDQQTLAFLGKVFDGVKSLPPDTEMGGSE
jgi:hypothetical protein